jgi:hypothetical protein
MSAASASWFEASSSGVRMQWSAVVQQNSSPRLGGTHQSQHAQRRSVERIHEGMGAQRQDLIGSPVWSTDACCSPISQLDAESRDRVDT